MIALVSLLVGLSCNQLLFFKELHCRGTPESVQNKNLSPINTHTNITFKSVLKVRRLKFTHEFCIPDYVSVLKSLDNTIKSKMFSPDYVAFASHCASNCAQNRQSLHILLKDALNSAESVLAARKLSLRILIVT